MRIVRNRSIPNVGTDRLLADASRLHEILHCKDAIRSFDGPRRQMIDLGLKLRAIRTEIVKRGGGLPNPECNICQRRPGVVASPR